MNWYCQDCGRKVHGEFTRALPPCPDCGVFRWGNEPPAVAQKMLPLPRGGEEGAS